MPLDAGLGNPCEPRRGVPLMTFYVEEVLSLLAATASLEEFGAVMALRAVAWKAGGPLPDKPARLAGICKVSRRRWDETLRPGLAEFIDFRDGYLRDDELERQHAAALKRVEAARLNGRLGGLAKAEAERRQPGLPLQELQASRHPKPLENNNRGSSYATSNHSYSYREEGDYSSPSLENPKQHTPSPEAEASLRSGVCDGGFDRLEQEPLPAGDSGAVPRRPPAASAAWRTDVSGDSEPLAGDTEPAEPEDFDAADFDWASPGDEMPPRVACGYLRVICGMHYTAEQLAGPGGPPRLGSGDYEFEALKAWAEAQRAAARASLTAGKGWLALEKAELLEVWRPYQIGSTAEVERGYAKARREVSADQIIGLARAWIVNLDRYDTARERKRYCGLLANWVRKERWRDADRPSEAA